MIILRPSDRFLLCSGLPAWKRLIRHAPTIDERIHLITTVFSDHNEVGMGRGISGDDAQTLADMVYEVRVSCNLILRVGQLQFKLPHFV